MSTESLSPQKPIKQQTLAVQARWAAEESTEEEAMKFYSSIPVERLLSVHKRMRERCELAGKVLNTRVNTPDRQKCKVCGISFENFKKKGKPDWWLNRPHYHPEDRNIILVDHFCSAACVSRENNKTQGVYGIPDQGMLPQDNPVNHPRQVKGDIREREKEETAVDAESV